MVQDEKQKKNYKEITENNGKMNITKEESTDIGVDEVVWRSVSQLTTNPVQVFSSGQRQFSWLKIMSFDKWKHVWMKQKSPREAHLFRDCWSVIAGYSPVG